jgi:HEPN domain-containing protein
LAASRSAQQWFKKSAENLRLAKLILNLEEKFYDHVCFNTQQAAEKAIKGFLTHHKVRFDKTHDIAVLVGLVRGVDQRVADKLTDADQLTKFAVRIRYPEEFGDPLIVDFKLATKTIKIAEAVHDLLEASLN